MVDDVSFICKDSLFTGPCDGEHVNFPRMGVAPTFVSLVLVGIARAKVKRVSEVLSESRAKSRGGSQIVVFSNDIGFPNIPYRLLLRPCHVCNGALSDIIWCPNAPENVLHVVCPVVMLVILREDASLNLRPQCPSDHSKLCTFVMFTVQIVES